MKTLTKHNFPAQEGLGPEEQTRESSVMGMFLKVLQANGQPIANQGSHSWRTSSMPSIPQSAGCEFTHSSHKPHYSDTKLKHRAANNSALDCYKSRSHRSSI